MPKIYWADHYATGVASVDGQHKEFFRRLNAFEEAVEKGQPKSIIIGTLTFLLDYVRVHFQEEERLMKAAGYDGVEAHQAEHRRLEERTQSLLSQYQKGQRFLATRLSRFLGEWMVDHILRLDMAYVPQVKRLPPVADSKTSR